MILPDWMIAEQMGQHGRITPFDERNIQPASYDMTLDNYFRFYVREDDGPNSVPYIDVKSPKRRTIQHRIEHYFEIGPLSFVLACSRETFRFPDNIAGRCEGKSSLGRLGLSVHVTAGFFDPGFEGTATFELFNTNHLPIRIYPGMKIAQMSFHQMAGHVRKRYGLSGNKYMGQGIAEPGPRESEYWKNFLEHPCDVCGAEMRKMTGGTFECISDHK